MRVLLCLMVLCACGPAPGGLLLTASGGTAVENGFTTADGYTVRFTRASMVVGQFSLATLASQDGPRSAGVLSVDLLQPEPRIVRSFSNVAAQRWDAVRWSLSNDGGVSLDLAGTLEKDSASKTFAWAFTADAQYGPCVESVTIPSNGRTNGELTVDVTRLWSDSLADAGTLRGEALFNADMGDGAVTLDDLRATPTPASYEPTVATGDLADFLEAQTHGIGGFNGAPCTGTAR